MANVLSFIIGAKDQASGVLGRVRASIGSFINSLASLNLATQFIGRAWAALKSGAEDVIGRFVAFERVTTKLSAALALTGDGSAAVVDDLKAFAEAMQRVTIYDSEAILAAITFAKSMGMKTKGIKEATTAAMGLASAYGMDLHTAMRMVYRASEGQTQSLRRYGIIIDQSLPPQERYNQLLRIGAQRFSIAKREANTTAGAMQQVKNVWDDVKRDIGEKVVKGLGLQGLFEGLVGALDKLDEWVKKNTTIQAFFGRIHDAAIAVAGVIMTIMEGGEKGEQTWALVKDYVTEAFLLGAGAAWDFIVDAFKKGADAFAKLLGDSPIGRLLLWASSSAKKIGGVVGEVFSAAGETAAAEEALVREKVIPAREDREREVSRITKDVRAKELVRLKQEREAELTRRGVEFVPGRWTAYEIADAFKATERSEVAGENATQKWKDEIEKRVMRDKLRESFAAADFVGPVAGAGPGAENPAHAALRAMHARTAEGLADISRKNREKAKEMIVPDATEQRIYEDARKERERIQKAAQKKAGGLPGDYRMWAVLRQPVEQAQAKERGAYRDWQTSKLQPKLEAAQRAGDTKETKRIEKQMTGLEAYVQGPAAAAPITEISGVQRAVRLRRTRGMGQIGSTRSSLLQSWMGTATPEEDRKAAEARRKYVAEKAHVESMPATTEKEKAKKTKAEEKLGDMERKVREAEAVKGKSYAELREAAMTPGGAKTAIREQRQTDREERRWQHTLRQAERTQGAPMGDIRTLGRRLSSRDQMVLAAEAQRKKEEAASLAAKALPENVDIIKKVMTGEQEVPEE